MAIIQHCPVCSGKRCSPIFRLPRVPIFCNQYWPAEADAVRAAGGTLDIVQCDGCGHVFNAAFDPDLIRYAVGYENSLHFSPTFGAYVEELAQRLIERYDITDKRILEIGCGDGGFLAALCEAGGNRGFGFDPSQTDRAVTTGRGACLTIKGGLYTADMVIPDIDVICSRHVLEHLQDPGGLLRSLREWHKGRQGAVAYLEVPNGEFCLEPRGIWDLIYEHVSYFTPRSLSHLVNACGYRILDMGLAFDDQFLWVEAALDDKAADEAEFAARDASPDGVRDGYKNMIETCRHRIEAFAAGGRKMALWGAGSKGVTFLNIADSAKTIGTVVDINPRKQHQHVAITGQRIVAPDELSCVRPDVIFVMNGLYMKEIAGMLDQLGVKAELLCVHSMAKNAAG